MKLSKIRYAYYNNEFKDLEKYLMPNSIRLLNAKGDTYKQYEPIAGSVQFNNFDAIKKSLKLIQPGSHNDDFMLQVKLPDKTYVLNINLDNNKNCAKLITALKMVFQHCFIQIVHPVPGINAVSLQVIGHGEISKEITDGPVSVKDMSNKKILIGDVQSGNIQTSNDISKSAVIFAKICNINDDFIENCQQIAKDVLTKSPEELEATIKQAKISPIDKYNDTYFDKLGITEDALDLTGLKATTAYDNPYHIDSQLCLHQLLKHIGNLWVETHTNSKTGKITPMDRQHIMGYIVKFEPTCRVKEGKQPMFYFYNWDTNSYTTDSDEFTQLVLSLTLDNADDRMVTDVGKHIVDFTTAPLPNKTPVEDQPLINPKTGEVINITYANNGLYNPNTGKLTKYNPNIVCLRHAITDLNLNLTMKDQPHLGMIDPITGKKLKQGWWYPLKLVENLAKDDDNHGKIDKQVYHAILQACRCAVTGNGKTQQMMLMYEVNGGAGKSSLLQLLQNIVGDIESGNTAPLSIADMNDPNKLAQAANAMLLISHENDFDHATRKSLARFKQVITEDPMPMKNLYKDVFFGRMHGFVMAASNDIPQAKNADGGYYRRIVAIPIKHNNMRPDNPKAKAGKEFENVINRWIYNKAVKEWFYWYLITQVPPCTHIDEPDASRNAKKQMQLDDDPTTAFVEDVVKKLKSDFITNDFLYQYYLNFASYTNAGFEEEHVGMRTFLKRLRSNQWVKRNFKPTNLRLKGKWNAADGKMFDELADKISGYAHQFAKKDTSNNNGDPYKDYGNSSKSQRGLVRRQNKKDVK